jgi:16S rRNA processing protein RimM
VKALFGTVLKPQGIKGELKLRPTSNAIVETVFIKNIAYKILSMSYREGFCYTLLSGVADRNAAELLRGAELYYERAPEELRTGEYFTEDMIGSSVLAGATVIGKITSVASYGAADVITIAGADGRTVSFPHLKRLVTEFNPTDKIMILSEDIFKEVAVYED